MKSLATSSSRYEPVVMHQLKTMQARDAEKVSQVGTEIIYTRK